MAGKSALSLRETAAGTSQLLASIGPELRQHYDDPQQLSERLAELLRKIGRSPNA